MKLKLFLLIAFSLIAACTTTQPEPTSTPLSPTEPPPPTTDINATLIATDPSIEVTFDGNECVVDGPNEIVVGEHVFVFHNQSGRLTSFLPGRNYPERTWLDMVDWIEDNCGQPGEDCFGTPPWIEVLFHDHSKFDDENNLYRQYDLNREAEYHIVVETEDGRIWPCGPFHVIAKQ